MDQDSPHAAELLGVRLALTFEAFSIGGNHRRIGLPECRTPARLDLVDDSLPRRSKRLVVGVEFPTAVRAYANRSAAPPVVGRLGRDGTPPTASRHERDHVLRLHGPAVRIQDAESHALRRPVAWESVSPRLVEMRRPQRRIDGGQWCCRGAVCGERRCRRWSQTEAKDPEIGLIVVRIERIPVAISVDRSPSRLAPLQRSQSLRGRRHAGLLESLRGLLQGDGLASLQEDHDQKTVVVGVPVVLGHLELRNPDPERIAIRIGPVRHRCIVSCRAARDRIYALRCLRPRHRASRALPSGAIRRTSAGAVHAGSRH